MDVLVFIWDTQLEKKGPNYDAEFSVAVYSYTGFNPIRNSGNEKKKLFLVLLRVLQHSFMS